jgi:hypothetical protein
MHYEIRWTGLLDALQLLEQHATGMDFEFEVTHVSLVSQA